jgi:UDP-N-acetylglucosamine--N-acetylmuramyl-(pentapeptide) pyrophosphoryl-undecaprenol N-acetylglucosamine transferase
VYPALTVLQALNKRVDRQSSQLSTLWIGGVGGMEADLVKREGVPFKAIPAAGVHGVGWRAMPGNLAQLGHGYQASRRILRSFHPDVMFFTGGFVAVPMALAGKGSFRTKTPSVLFVPDIEPGLALNALARFADRIAVTTDESLAFYSRKKRVVVTGYPVRPELLGWSREQAFRVLNLEQDLPVLLVLGGSTGAQSINQALVKALPVLLENMQIIHITGQRNWAEVQAAGQELTPDLAQRYHVNPYLHGEMGAALRAADLVLSRAGASALGEYPAFGLPAILAPYPYAWRYQQVNAEYLAKHGAAVILADADLPRRLSGMVLDLLRNTAKLEQMRSAMLGLARPLAAQRIAELIDSLATKDRGDL